MKWRGEHINPLLKFIRNKIVIIVPEQSQLFRVLCLVAFRINAIKKHKLRKTMKVDIPVVEHCNLCCRGCTAFAPLANENFLDFASYEKDMRKLAELTGREGGLYSLTYTGGEPLLHPELKNMLVLARELFPEARLNILTNGTLIPKQEEIFWETCAKCDVEIDISKYPIKLDEKRINEIRNTWHIKFGWVGGKDTPVKKMWKYPIDLQGRIAKKDSFAICNQVNSYIRMKNGKIYPCNTTACIENFNQYFGKKLELIPNRDYIELDKIDDIQKIFQFLVTQPAFCRYCNRSGVTFGYEWSVSKKDISEWV